MNITVRACDSAAVFNSHMKEMHDSMHLFDEQFHLSGGNAMQQKTTHKTCGGHALGIEMGNNCACWRRERSKRMT